MQRGREIERERLLKNDNHIITNKIRRSKRKAKENAHCNLTRQFVVKVCKDLKPDDGDSTAVTEHKNPVKAPNTIITSKFV